METIFVYCKYTNTYIYQEVPSLFTKPFGKAYINASRVNDI